MRVVTPGLLEPPVKGIHYLLPPHRRHLHNVPRRKAQQERTAVVMLCYVMPCHAIPCHIVGIRSARGSKQYGTGRQKK